jgi:hypothetical protein
MRQYRERIGALGCGEELGAHTYRKKAAKRPACSVE